MKNYQYLVNQAGSFATLAASLIEELRQKHYNVETKSSPNDMVTEVDKRVEEYLVNLIQDKFPNDSIIGEEGSSVVGNSDISWVIDPIDGTTNFIYNFPSFAISIGVKEGSKIVAGAVLNIPESSLYSAASGLGAFKNSKPIHVRMPTTISQSLIGTGFGYSARRRVTQAKLLETIIADIRDIRRMGAASLDLCTFAEGKLDGYFEAGLWPWDYTAATIIARESGGIVCGLDSQEPTEELTIAATSYELVDFFRSKLRDWIPLEH